MALISMGPMVSKIIGSIGGVTYSSNRGGLTIRRKPFPVKVTNKSQGSIRATLGYVTRYWSTLDEAVRLQWEAYSTAHPVNDRFGNPQILQGLNWFVKITLTNMLAYGSSSPGQDAPPVSDPTIAVQSIVASDGLADGAVILTPTLVGVGAVADKLQVQVAGPFSSPARISVYSRFTDLANAAGNAASVTVEDLQTLAWYGFRMRYLELNQWPTNWVYEYYQAPDVA